MSSDTQPRPRRRTRHNADTGRVGALAKHHGRDHPEVVALRQLLAEQRAERLVREVAEAMPPISDDVRQRLAEILAPTAAGGAA